jgi:NADPH-dependent curcumin reductase CurA
MSCPKALSCPSCRPYMFSRQNSVFKQIAFDRDIPGYPPTLALGFLGGPALAAYFGLHDICHVNPSHVVLISGAAG